MGLFQVFGVSIYLIIHKKIKSYSIFQSSSFKNTPYNLLKFFPSHRANRIRALGFAIYFHLIIRRI